MVKVAEGATVQLGTDIPCSDGSDNATVLMPSIITISSSESLGFMWWNTLHEISFHFISFHYMLLLYKSALQNNEVEFTVQQ